MSRTLGRQALALAGCLVVGTLGRGLVRLVDALAGSPLGPGTVGALSLVAGFAVALAAVRACVRTGRYALSEPFSAGLAIGVGFPGLLAVRAVAAAAASATWLTWLGWPAALGIGVALGLGCVAAPEFVLTRLLAPVCAVGCAALVGMICLALMGYDPVAAAHEVVHGAQQGKWGLRDDLGYILYNATPLLLTGLAVASAFRTGLFNIGGRGQILVSCLACAWVGAFPGLPGFLHLPLAVGSGVLAGAAWGAIPGLLKAWRGAHEVIITIMMNFVAAALTGYFCTYPLKESASSLIPQTAPISESLHVPRLAELLKRADIEFPGYVQANVSLLVALLLAGAVYVFLWHTRWGYELRAVGLNPSAAEYGGIRVPRAIAMAMALSGALSGACCLDFICGQKYRYMHDDAMAYSENGFLGIAVALLGQNHPAGVVAAAFFFAFLVRLGGLVEFHTHVPKDLVLVLQAVIILFLIVGNEVFRRLAERYRASLVRSGRSVPATGGSAAGADPAPASAAAPGGGGA
ncbi:MAG: ABC transporter permease [Planctomycetes bacterium]|nr:ABC transporter permease [Planctomycetota bacterium]